MTRRDKANYYLDIAATVCERSTCLRKHYGAVIVKNDTIIATGYNGAPRGRKNCCDLGECLREKYQIPSGERYELCRSVHAEANAIIAVSRDETIGSTLYLACREPKDGSFVPGTNSCSMCKRLVINAGIATVVIRDTVDSYRVIDVQEEWVENDSSLDLHGGY